MTSTPGPAGRSTRASLPSPSEGVVHAASLPSALGEIKGIATALGRAPAIFLDYDGTLTPIVADPNAARIGTEERSVLRSLSQSLPVAIVSGRNLDDLKRLVAVEGLIYSGNHGWEIEGSGERFRRPLDDTMKRSLAEALTALEQATRALTGVFVERKRFSIAVHTRGAGSEAEREKALAEAAKAKAYFDGLELTFGKEIAELRPAASWDKGSAVGYILDSLPSQRTPLYIGDDQTDEDAFAVVSHRHGVGVVVGQPPATEARFSLTDPGEVLAFLHQLGLRWL